MASTIGKIEKKKKADKEKLVEEVVWMLESNQFQYEQFTYNLCREALRKWSNKNLKEIL